MHEVASGGSVLDPAIVQRLLAQRAGKPGSPLSQLTEGELDVLRLMAEGYSNAGIAAETQLATGTVEKRIAAVFMKLGLTEREDVNRRVRAVLLYLRESGTGADDPDRPCATATGAGTRRGHPRALTSSAVDDKRAAESGHPIGHVLQPAARAHVCWSNPTPSSWTSSTTLRSRSARVTVVVVAARVLAAVAERLDGHEVERDLELGRPPAAAVSGGDLEGHVERQPPDVRPDGGGDAAVGQDTRVDAAGQVLQAEHGVLRLVGEVLELSRDGGLALRQLAQLSGQRDQLVLGTVVEVALDAASLLVLGGDQPLARLLQLLRAVCSSSRLAATSSEQPPVGVGELGLAA